MCTSGYSEDIHKPVSTHPQQKPHWNVRNIMTSGHNKGYITSHEVTTITIIMIMEENAGIIAHISTGDCDSQVLVVLQL